MMDDLTALRQKHNAGLMVDHLFDRLAGALTG
jgi:hypothetical protein